MEKLGSQKSWEAPMKKTIQVEHRIMSLSGEENDVYYKYAQSHIDGFADIRKISARLEKNSVIFDVGANIGLTSMLLSVLMPHAIIHAFEPSPRNLRHLSENISSNNIKNVVLHHIAISESRGLLQFVESSADEGGSGSWSHAVVPGTQSPQASVREVESAPLDDFFSLSPGFLKIDVEGHEPEVLAGARQILQQLRPLIHMEFNPWPLNAYGGHSPAAFAETIFKYYDVEGSTTQYLDLVFSTVAQGNMKDLTMRLKSDVVAPSLYQMSFPPAAIALIESLLKR